MRYVAFLGVVVLLFACNAGAQVSAANSLGLAFPSPAATAGAGASSGPLAFGPTASAPWMLAPMTNAAASSTLADPPQEVQGVFETYSWQAYFGYTYFRFYELPGVTENLNGFSYSMVYYFKDWLGADGEFVGTFGSQGGTNSRFLLGAGGPRLRWSAPRGLELWAHGLVGYSHFTPQTAFGKQSALGYELGGGVDINANHRKLAYRVQADMVGTRYFNTLQYSPRISVGIVFKF